MRIWLASALLLVSAAAILLPGCRRSKSSSPPPTAATYARPTTSPIASEEAALRLKTAFPAESEDRFDDHGSSTSISNDNIRPQIFTGEARVYFTLSESTLDDCETAAARYLADLSKRCAEAGGSMTAGKFERTGGGSSVSYPYTLPRRTGKAMVTIEPRPERRPEAKRLTVTIREEAEGDKTP